MLPLHAQSDMLLRHAGFKVVIAVESKQRKLHFAHWATAAGAGEPWIAPPAGWSTNPPKSVDGGKGSWNTWCGAGGLGSRGTVE